MYDDFYPREGFLDEAAQNANEAKKIWLKIARDPTRPLGERQLANNAVRELERVEYTCNGYYSDGAEWDEAFCFLTKLRASTSVDGWASPVERLAFRHDEALRRLEQCRSYSEAESLLEVLLYNGTNPAAEGYYGYVLDGGEDAPGDSE